VLDLALLLVPRDFLGVVLGDNGLDDMSTISFSLRKA